MGEVYRATDTKLGRDVAIKVLPPDVAQDPERLARFEREAHLLAALNHPNVAAIYGLEETDGTPFLALELVEGEDLKERLARGAIPVDEALEIAKQVAEALEEAHDKGIVHRDLKPANVKLTPDGTVKVLDFGLAKAWGGGTGSGGPSADLSQSPTLTHTGTQAGVILGTAAYMSPEQARGRPVDKRADIWSFGVVLLEMLTGRNTFAAATVSDTLASVLKSAPDFAALPPEVPSPVRRALERCLRKDPRERARDIGDVRLDLAEAAAATEGSTPGAGQTGDPRHRFARGLVVGAAIGGAVVAFGAWMMARTQTGPQALAGVARLEATGPPGTSLDRGLAISPDGSRVAFAGGDKGGEFAIWVRPLDSLEATRVKGTEGGRHPFWSPDSHALGFFADRQLMVVDLAGGVPRALAPSDAAAMTRGGTWGPDGTIVFAPSIAGPLSKVTLDGTRAPEPATRLEEAAGSHRFPHFLPDGRHFVFYSSGGTGNEPGELRLGNLGALETRLLDRSSSSGVYSPPGDLLYADATEGSAIVARPFDLARGTFSGDPFTIGITIPAAGAISGLRSLSASRNGTLAYRADPPDTTELVWVDRQGKVLARLGSGRYRSPRIRPGHRQLVVGRYAASVATVGFLWSLDADRGVASPLGLGAVEDSPAEWSPDGRRLAFVRSNREGGLELCVSDPGDPGSARAIAAAGSGDWFQPYSWSPDGARLFFGFISRGRSMDIKVVDVQGGGKVETWLATPFLEAEPDVSPDGRLVAFTSNVGGAPAVYVKRVEGTGPAVRVSADEASHPHWSPRGGELFYLSARGEMVSSAVSLERGVPRTGQPSTLFMAATVADSQRPFDVAPDGQRFLLARPAPTPEEPMIVILGFDRVLRSAVAGHRPE
jgi:Tol biopolymer transport system component